MNLPIFYSFRRCPYAMRARLAVAMSGAVCILREVKLSAKPAAMLAVSPKATVPVMLLPDGSVLDESLDIMRWALGQNDPEHWLDRDDAGLIAQNDGAFKYHLDRYKYPERHDSDAVVHRTEGARILQQLDIRLQEGRSQEGGYLCGPQRGLADAAIIPFVRQFAVVDPEWFAALPLPSLQRWLAGYIGSDLFVQVMHRQTPWVEGDDAVIFSAD